MNLSTLFTQIIDLQEQTILRLNASLSANYTLQGNQFNGVQQLVKTDSNGQLPSGLISSYYDSSIFITQNQFQELDNRLTLLQQQLANYNINPINDEDESQVSGYTTSSETAALNAQQNYNTTQQQLTYVQQINDELTSIIG